MSTIPKGGDGLLRATVDPSMQAAPEPGARRDRALGWATVLLLLIGLARSAQVASHSPLLGYANNWDFIKLSSTAGIWLDEPGVDPLAGHPPAPYSRYRSHGKRMPDFKYLSSELLLVHAAIVVSDAVNLVRGLPRTRFDLRVLGAVKTLLFFAAGAFLTVLFFRRSPWLGLASAFIFAAVICDPINTLYFNTLYMDDSTVLFTYLAIGTALLLLGAPSPPPYLIATFCGSLILAGWSKMQHPGLPLALVLGVAIALARRKWPGQAPARRTLIPAVAAAAVTLIGAAIHTRSPSVHGMVVASATDVGFHMVLPAVNDPAEALVSLGLPARCGAYIGKSWFHPGMDQVPCPEIARLSRIQVLRILLKNPAAIARILAHAVAISRPFLLWFGHIEGRSYAPVEEAGRRFFSLGRAFERLPLSAYSALVILSLAGGALSIALLLLDRTVPGAAFCVLLNATIAATLLASLLGDGYVDFARHLYLGQNALLISPVAAMLVLGQLAIRFGSPLVRRSLRQRVAAGG